MSANGASLSWFFQAGQCRLPHPLSPSVWWMPRSDQAGVDFQGPERRGRMMWRDHVFDSSSRRSPFANIYNFC